jgi:seryl-tRNA synthetase
MNIFKLYEQLKAAFPKESAEALAHVLSELTEEIQDTVTKQDFAELKAVVRDLAEAQSRTEQRVEELAEAQRRTEQRVEELAQAQKRTEERLSVLTDRVDSLAKAQKRTEQSLVALIKRVEGAEIRLAKLDGRTLEMQFRQKAPAYLGKLLRRTRVVSVGNLAEDLEKVLNADEWADLVEADVVLRGRAEIEGQACEAYAVVEVSVMLAEHDVERAARRAALLRKKGWKAMAVVAGEEADPRLIEKAAQAGVAVLEDGRQFNWEQALAKA